MPEIGRNADQVRPLIVFDSPLEFHSEVTFEFDTE